MMHGIRNSFVVSLIEKTHSYIHNPAKSTVFYVPSIYQFGKKLLQRSYDVPDERSLSAKPIFTGFINEKLAETLEDRRSNNQLYSNNM